MAQTTYVVLIVSIALHMGGPVYKARVNGLRTFAKNVLKIPRGLVVVLEPRLQDMGRAMLRVLTAGERKAWDEHGEVPDRVVNNIHPLLSGFPLPASAESNYCLTQKLISRGCRQLAFAGPVAQS